MTNSMTFDQIKARHDDLYKEYREEIRGGVLFGADKQTRAIFLERVNQLLSDADNLYIETHDGHQRAQIEIIKAEWQIAKATVFNLDTLFKEKFQWDPPPCLPREKSCRMKSRPLPIIFLDRRS